MQIHIDTATDDLPAVIRMLQAYAPQRKLRVTNGKDETIAELTASSVKITDDPTDITDEEHREFNAAIEKHAAVPPCSAHANEPDPAAHCYTLPNGDCVSEDPRCMHLPTPEEVFTRVMEGPKPIPSLFDAPTHSDVTVDAAGLPWDARIHSGAKTKLANGNWKLLRNVDPALVASVEAELRGAPKPALSAAEPATSTGAPPVPVAPPVSPPPPPAPPAPKPITNAAELVAAVMDKRFTTDQVNAACQAVGVENVASLLAKQDKLPLVLRELGV